MSLFGRLYRGETRTNFIGYRKRWYIASGIILLICATSMIFRGFNLGIEFAGGNQFLIPVKAGVTLQHVREAAETAGAEVSSAQSKGTGGNHKYVIRTAELTTDKRAEVKAALVKASGVEVSDTTVSSSWGKSVTQKALLGLAVFLVVVALYLWVRYEQKMAMAALLALAHDLLLTAGVYSLVGFEVTPGTIIGLLTILGYSLYDTVVVFDKVDENSKGILGHNRRTYAEEANLAVNQTLMRSINTSLIALLPVAGLLFVGAGILGVGTLKDLALVLFVGMMTGAYSSLFLATPWLVDLKMLEPKYKQHAQRVLTRRAGIAKGDDPDRRATRAARVAKAAGRPAEKNGKAVLTKDAVAVDTDTDGDVPEKTVPEKASAGSGRPGPRKAVKKRPAGRRR
jgi:preprotein translocase subunit SecF